MGRHWLRANNRTRPIDSQDSRSRRFDGLSFGSRSAPIVRDSSGTRGPLRSLCGPVTDRDRRIQPTSFGNRSSKSKPSIPESGYYYHDEEHRVYRLTWRGAILMTWKLLWPIKQIRAMLARREGRAIAARSRHGAIAILDSIHFKASASGLRRRRSTHRRLRAPNCRRRKRPVEGRRAVARRRGLR